MRRPLALFALTATVLALGAGCVEQTRYDALEARMKDQDARLTKTMAEAVDASSRAQIADAERGAAQKEVELLKAQLDAKDLAASMKTPAEAHEEASGFRPQAPGGETADASSPEARGLRPEASDRTVLASFKDEWKVNPATGGIILDAGALFAPGGGELRAGAEAVLDRLVAEVNRKELGGADVRVEGHTDATPINKSKNRDNWELAGKRALAVLEYLEGHGVAPERLSFAGFGATRPMSAGGDARADRRVEVLLRLPAKPVSRS